MYERCMCGDSQCPTCGFEQGTLDTVDPTVLLCDRDRSCCAPVTHIDQKGFVYCTNHGLSRRSCGIPCRKLRDYEIRKLGRGETLSRY